MEHRRIDKVMTREVVRVRPEATFKEVAALLAEHRISGMPVVDADGKVVGVVSESDLMARQAEQGADWLRVVRPGRRRPSLRRTRRAAAAKARAVAAGQLMSKPAVTVRPDDTVTEAARSMAGHGVERLPVVDADGRLVGIVTRSDLLGVFLRSDAQIRADVVDEVLVRGMWIAPNTIEVTVHQGVVTLTGQLEQPAEVEVLRWMTGQVDGVVAVVDQLTWRHDDRRPGLSEDRLRRR
jgi:CBS domain-containing protein